MADAKKWHDDLVEDLAAALWLDQNNQLGLTNTKFAWKALVQKDAAAAGRMRSLAVAALNFFSQEKNALPFRIGFVLGALANDETMKAVYPKATKSLRRSAIDLLASVAGYIPYSESVVPKGKRR